MLLALAGAGASFALGLHRNQRVEQSQRAEQSQGHVAVAEAETNPPPNLRMAVSENFGDIGKTVHSSLATVRTQIQALEETLTTPERRNKSPVRLVEASERHLQAMDRRLHESEQRSISQQSVIYSYQAEVGEYESQIRAYERRIEELQESRPFDSTSLQALGRQLYESEKRCIQYQNDINLYTRRISEIQSEYESRLSASAESMDELTNALAETEEAEAWCRAKLAEERLEGENQLGELQHANADLLARVEATHAQMDRMELELEAANRTHRNVVAEFRARLADATSAKESSEAKLDFAFKAMHELERANSELQSRCAKEASRAQQAEEEVLRLWSEISRQSAVIPDVAHSVPQWTTSLPLTSTSGRGSCNSEFEDGDVESVAKSESAVDGLRAGQPPRRTHLPGRSMGSGMPRSATIPESPRTINRIVSHVQSPAKPQSPSKMRPMQRYDALTGRAKVPELDLLKSASDGCFRKGGHWPMAGSITPRSSLTVVESPRISSKPRGVAVISQPKSPELRKPQSQPQSPELRSPKASPLSRPKADSALNSGSVRSRAAREILFEHGSTLESVTQDELSNGAD